MRIVLAAINAKYIHSNLAVYSLKASAGEYEPVIDLVEYTINHQIEEIFAGIYRKKPDILLLSCYIWNRGEVIEVSSMIRKVLPKTKIWAGGPEVTYDAEQFLRENPQFDGVMAGEGEQSFYRLIRYYMEQMRSESPEDIPGIIWRERAFFRADEYPGSDGPRTAVETEKNPGSDEPYTAVETEKNPGSDEPCAAVKAREASEQCGERIHRNLPVIPVRTLDGLPFVYRDLEKFENRIIYYESSRGCPFSCSYCLSSVDKSVRYRSMELVEKELQYFLDKKVKQVKFVDRTFNCNRERTLALWKFMRDHDNGVTNFHCEVSADLLNEEELQVLSELRPGLLQLEIGVQTVNRDTLEAIHRTAPFEKIAEHVSRIQNGHNVHQHLDLIAGLPYEDFESFRTSFDTVYRLYPQELQLGFLKVLRGSEMYLRAEEYGIIYRDKPPYEVLATKWISCDELLRLKEIEEMLEVYYNSLQFRNTIRAAEQLFCRPIELYEALADYYQSENLNGKSYSRAQRFEILRRFLHDRCAETEKKYYDEMLILDLYLRENAKSRPAWASDPAVIKEDAVRFYQREAEEHRYLPELSGMSWKQMMRMTHLERFTEINPTCVLDCADHEAGLPVRQPAWIVFKYERRDPLTGDAEMVQI